MLIRTKAPARPTHRRDRSEGFGELGEFLKAVADKERSMVFDEHYRLSAAISGLGETQPSDGGFLVQSDLSAELITRVYETGQIASRVQRISLKKPGTLGLKINAVDEDSRADGSRWGGVQAYFAKEADAATPTKPEFRQMQNDPAKAHRPLLCDR